MTNKRWIAISFWSFLALSIIVGVRMAVRAPQLSTLEERVVAVTTALLIVAAMQTGHSLSRVQNLRHNHARVLDFADHQHFARVVSCPSRRRLDRSMECSGLDGKCRQESVRAPVEARRGTAASVTAPAAMQIAIGTAEERPPVARGSCLSVDEVIATEITPKAM